MRYGAASFTLIELLIAVVSIESLAPVSLPTPATTEGQIICQ